MEMGTVFGLVFVGIGLFMLIRGFIQFRTMKASQGWPTVAGQVVHASVDVSVSTDSDGMRSRRYTPHVVYSYAVLGQQYTNDKVAIGSKWNYASQARAASKLRYQSGDQVTVCYNPEDPAQSVLEPGAMGGVWGTLLIGIVFIIIGGFVIANTL